MKKIDSYHPDQCRDILLGLDDQIAIEKIDIYQANKRILAQDIRAKIDVPNFDKSPYDGYVFRGEDTLGASKDSPIRLEIIEEIPAGYVPKKEIRPGQAAKILTGGPIPKGGNVCYKKEKTRYTDNYVEIFEEIRPNKDIIPQGEDTTKGDLLASKGSILNPGILGKISSQGIKTIKVYKRPVLGIFLSGDELQRPGEKLEPAKIYESNYISLKCIFENIGFQVKNLGLVTDNLGAISKKTAMSIDQVDILVTTGGASVGDYDYALSSIEEIGGHVLFWKTAMKPGGSILASRYKGKTILGLSGNPAAAILSLYRVCLPYLYKFIGRKDIYPQPINMILAKDFKKSSPAVRLLRGRMKEEESKLYFYENNQQGNGVLSSFIDCNAFLEIPMGSGPIQAGTILKGYSVSSIFGQLGE